MEVVEIALAKLVPDPNNARKHDAKNLAAIKGSLLKFGQQKPVVITAENIVLAGNGTLAAAKELGWKKISCVITTLDKFNAAAYALADNRSAELAKWDDEILGSTLQALREDGFDIESIGFDIENLGLDDKGSKDNLDTAKEFLIVVQCENETDQRQIYEEFLERGLQCKLMS